jgi:hypothetical protein
MVVPPDMVTAIRTWRGLMASRCQFRYAAEFSHLILLPG